MAVLEIYNEAVHDLLALSSGLPPAPGGSPVGSPVKGISAEAVAACTLDVAGLAAGELPAGMDRCVC